MLDEADRQLLRRALRRQSVAAAGLLAIPLLLAAGLVTLQFGGDNLARGPAWVLALASAWWMWLLRRAPAQVRRLRSDLANGAVATAEGIAAVASRRGFGLFAPSRWRLVVAGREFDAGDFDLADLYPGQVVRVRHGVASSRLLGVRPVDAAGAAPALELAERERALLALLVAGLSDKLIARELGLAPATVRTYNSALFRKLGVVDRRAAVAWAQSQAGKMSIDNDTRRSTSD